MDLICSTAETLTDLVTSTGSLLLTALNVNFVVLNTVLSGLVDCTFALMNFLGLVFRGILLAGEEFTEFISEIIGGVIALAVILQKTAVGIVKLLCYLSTSGYDLIGKFAQFIDAEAKNCVRDIGSIIVGLKNFVVLIINSILMILEFLPWFISSTGTGIFNLFAFLLKSFVTDCNRITAYAIRTVKGIAMLIKGNICDIPRDAYIGLLIIVLTYLAHKYAKRRIIRFFRRSLNVFSLAIQRTIQGYQHVYAFLLSCARKLNSVCLLLVQRLPRLNDSDVNDENTEVTDQNPSPNESSDEGDEGESHSKNFNQLKRELENQKGAQRCIICLENPKNMIFLPCRHMCACQDCCQTLVYRRAPCPLCRKFIRNTIRVYT